jgi:glyoxylase-like metal-dependent hydrolase (beta-lactamase superfamily II)
VDARWLRVIILAGIVLVPAAPAAAQCVGQGEIHTAHLRGGLSVLQGYGSNITVSTGPDGTLLVDDEYAELVNNVRASLAALHAPPVKMVINTHWHCDHTGGNESFGREGALIIAHENTARRMQTDQVMSLYGRQAAYPPAAWPKVLVHSSLRLRWNGEDVDLIALDPAHTDGDLAVFFRGENVLATGDVFVTGNYLPPYFDDVNGGSLEGMIAAAGRLLGLVDEHTIIVPGHGEVGNRSSLLEYRDHLTAIRTQIKDAIERGLTEDQVVALPPTEAIAKQGRGTDRWVRIVYREYHR